MLPTRSASDAKASQEANDLLDYMDDDMGEPGAPIAPTGTGTSNAAAVARAKEANLQKKEDNTYVLPILLYVLIIMIIGHQMRRWWCPAIQCQEKGGT